MDALALSEVLLDVIESDGSTRFVDQLYCDAKAALLAGKGTVGSLTQSSVNGKSFTKTADMNPAMVMRACQLALADHTANGTGTARATYADFRGMER
jgi:hypothetical protein